MFIIKLKAYISFIFSPRFIWQGFFFYFMSMDFFMGKGIILMMNITGSV